MTRAVTRRVWPTALVVALGSGLPLVVEAKFTRTEDTAAIPHLLRVVADNGTAKSHYGDAYSPAGDGAQVGGRRSEQVSALAALERSAVERAAERTSIAPVAQFQLPQQGTAGPQAPPAQSPSRSTTDAQPSEEATAEQPGTTGAGQGSESSARDATVGTDGEQPGAESAAETAPGSFMADFRLPQPGALGGPGGYGGPPRPVTQFLKYQYSFGSESDITYRRHRDLDKRLRDNSLLLAPQVNGYIIYRPTDSVEMLLETILEREIPASEQKTVTLPSGETQFAPKRRVQLAIDQALVTFKRLGPFDLTVGRRNFEDERHWLYDTSLDTAFVRLKQGDFNAELSASRKDLADLDLFQKVKRGRINNYMFYVDYRGIEDIKLAGYAIYSIDSARLEGWPLHMGVRAYGTPIDAFNFWADFGVIRGKDEFSRKFAGRGFDAGATYRFLDLPFHPSVTLGYAYGSGDGNPNDNKNDEFRQTGLQSNEWKGAGVSKFKYYGEALDPELSNLRIFTAGIAFRPARNVFVDLVYHKYKSNHIADQIRNWALTAQMNQDDTQLSKDVGSAFDIVIGLRNLFGLRRFGVDLRAGMFFPGKAFRNDVTVDPDNPQFRRADKGLSVIAKFWW